MLEACEMEVSLDCVNVSQHELEVIFYVAGYCCNQESNHYVCKNCHSLLISNYCLIIVDRTTNFFDFFNRGKLKCPANSTLVLCCTTKVFCSNKSSTLFNKFLRLRSPNDTFVITVLSF